ncbi:MAG: ATP-grasp domain-containing protein [Promethearchaeota archaeon]|nr:MAG: ATP-grasp domain-containing protein [Candidatus Lokiarchaeota archaeon]
MKIGLLTKRTTMLAGKLIEFFETNNHEVTPYTLADLTINKSLLNNDYYILKSKQLFFLYAGYFIEANNLPIFPNPNLTYKHKNRIEAHYLIKKAKLPSPDYFFGSYKALKQNLLNTHFPLILKPTMGSGSRGVRIINRIEDLKPMKGQLIYLEKYIEGTHYNVYFIGNDICALEKPPLSDEHAEMTKVKISSDMKEFISKWTNRYDIPFGHLDLVREESTGKLYVVDPGNFPEFDNWKCEGDPVSKIGNILLEKYKNLKNKK